MSSPGRHHRRVPGELRMRRPRLDFLRELWRLAGPYWNSEDRWAGRGLLAAVIGLNLGLIAINVRFNTWNADFYNAVQEFNESEFYKQIAIFTGLALLFVLVSVYQDRKSTRLNSSH